MLRKRKEKKKEEQNFDQYQDEFMTRNLQKMKRRKNTRIQYINLNLNALSTLVYPTHNDYIHLHDFKNRMVANNI